MRELCFLCPGNPPGWGRARLLPGPCLSRLTLRLAAGGPIDRWLTPVPTLLPVSLKLVFY